MIKITVYHLAVKLELQTTRLKSRLDAFLQKYYTSKGIAVSATTAAPAKEFVSRVGETAYVIHTNQFIHFLHYLKELGDGLGEVERLEATDYEIVRHEYEVRSKWVLRDYQEPIVEFITNNPVKSKMVSLQTGRGKSQPLTANIKTPQGWVPMWSIKPGNVITAADGTPTTVTGIYPQGSIPIYKVTFADGRSTEVSADHLWKVYYINTVSHRRWRVVDTNEIMRMLKMPNPRVYVPLIEAEDCPDVELPVEPYLLGLLLADGCLRAGSIKFTTPDRFLVDEIAKVLPADMSINKINDRYDWGIKNPRKLREALTELGLYGTLSYEKFIPEVYKYASAAQRLALLQGLLDGDGTVTTDKHTSYCTTSKRLSDDVTYLVRSLGGIASLGHRFPTYTHNGEKRKGRIAYNISIRHKKPSTLFRLPRKKERTDDNNQYSADLKLRVMSVEPTGVKPAQCISIDHPEHLYVTDDFIVTHNTMLSLVALSQVGMRIGICILPGFIEKWVGDIVSIHDAKTTDIMVVSGSKAIRGLIAMARDKELTAKYYIFSSRTMQDYITAYEENPENCVLMYGASPFEFFQLAGIGSLLVDETHMHFHAIFKVILYSNVQFQLGLSATMISDDSVVSRVHKIVYTDKQTYTLEELDKYADVYALAYSIPESMIRKVKTTNFGSNNYAHAAFENSMLKNRPHLDFYIQLITANMEVLYLDQYAQDDKCLIFVGTVKLATMLADIYKKLLPHLKVNRYCEDDPEENLYESDIIISTVISSGTAVDIKNLRVVLQTVSISSAPQNIQNLGRLRRLDDGKDVRFGYLFAENIHKQVQYHNRRQDLFAARVASHRTYKAKTTSTLKLPHVAA